MRVIRKEPPRAGRHGLIFALDVRSCLQKHTDDTKPESLTNALLRSFRLLERATA